GATGSDGGGAGFARALQPGRTARRRAMDEERTMRRALGVLLCAAALAAGCDENDRASTSKPCATPLRGARYGLCGRVSTAGLSAPSGAVWLVGSVDST